MHQAFSKAMCAGTRNGSGTFVYELYDTLKLLWGGAPSSRSLSCGIDTFELNSVVMTDDECQLEDS